ncbi:hypothetical protein IPA_04375 [Ignicoccus pacificus DSM 13166]|uniref:Fe/B12 periplasmic-binding domain-containing protein n=1 Tax=Ignicoccus pacificus DSM 13166 TaxID=940294 RepID=A0A977KB38_9CREN|nr:hypothetical protein IPA_04375 [Ignicoccus pacificus DSM 13166]
MKKISLIFLICLVSTVLAINVVKATNSITVVDSLNRTVIIYHFPPRRVVALTPALAETVCSINCTKLVGTVSPVNWPPKLVKMVKEGKIALVGTFWMPDLEKIASLKPDVILADEGSDLRMINVLNNLGIPIVFTKGGLCGTVSCVERDILLVGKVLGNQEASKKIVNYIEGNLTKASTEAMNYTKVKVIMLFYPFTWGIYAVGNNTFINDIVTRLNAANMIEMKGWPRITKEYLVAKKPDVYVLFAGEKVNPKVAVKDALSLGLRARWICVIYGTASDVTQRPGPRLSKAPWILLDVLHKHENLELGVYCSSG